MLNFIKNFYQNFREYIVLILLLLISLSFLPLNKNQSVQKIKTFAFGSFALLNSVVSEIPSIFSNEDELNKLRKLNAELMLQLNKLREYGIENNKLRNLLTYVDTSGTDLFPARIISTLVTKVQGNFIINKGRLDSIKIGMPVINDLGLVGIIINVADNYSLVRSLQNVNFKVSVRNQITNVNGVLSWDGNNLVIKNIPTTYEMNVGDRIVSSDFSTLFPPSIPIGVVQKKEETISGILSNIVVKPFAELSKIKNVLVMDVVPSRQIDSLEMNLLIR
ncbi:MAG: rod shape-determining protein MreC [Ignavibacteria bacterium]|jgi:rod shape-determining protein MreC